MSQSSPVTETASNIGTLFGKVEEIYIKPDGFGDQGPTIPAPDGPIPVRPISPAPPPVPPPTSSAWTPPAPTPPPCLPPTFIAPLSPPLYASASPREEQGAAADGQCEDGDWDEVQQSVRLWNQGGECDVDEIGDEGYDDEEEDDERDDCLSDGGEEEGEEEGEVGDAGGCAHYQMRVDLAEMMQRQSEIQRRDHALQYFQMQLLLLEHQQRNS